MSGPDIHPNARSVLEQADLQALLLVANMCTGERVHPLNACAVLMASLTKEMGRLSRATGRQESAAHFLAACQALLAAPPKSRGEIEAVARDLNRHILALVGEPQH